MKIGEMLKVLGININDECIAENTQNIPSATNPPVEPEVGTGSTVEQINQPQSTPPQNETVNTDELAATIKKQTAEIEALKKVNAALLSKTPVQEEELSVEDMLYRAVIGTPKNQ